MIQKHKWLWTVLFMLAAGANAQRLPADKKATKSTIALYKNLYRLPARGYLVGHQDALAYGVHWKYKAGNSDMKAVTGDYPALYGWELGDLEKGAPVNLDSVPFAAMKKYIREGYERGGAITISWHGNNPLTGKSAWDTTSGTVAAILPGGSKHALFVQQLDTVASFLKSLKGKKGEAIPLIFRPFHELTGSWFWWGAKSCTAAELIMLFRFEVDYLRNTKGLHNLLICYNTANDFQTQEQFLERYPGDDYVDIVSFDGYQYGAPSNSVAFAEKLSAQLSVVEAVAKEKQKIAAIGELGYNLIPDVQWFTKTVSAAVKKHHFAYLLYWRNAGFKPKDNAMEYYIPYKGHAAAPDFMQYYRQPETLFEKEAAALKLYR